MSGLGVGRQIGWSEAPQRKLLVRSHSIHSGSDVLMGALAADLQHSLLPAPPQSLLRQLPPHPQITCYSGAHVMGHVRAGCVQGVERGQHAGIGAPPP